MMRVLWLLIFFSILFVAGPDEEQFAFACALAAAGHLLRRQAGARSAAAAIIILTLAGIALPLLGDSTGS